MSVCVSFNSSYLSKLCEVCSACVLDVSFLRTCFRILWDCHSVSVGFASPAVQEDHMEFVTAGVRVQERLQCVTYQLGALRFCGCYVAFVSQAVCAGGVREQAG